VIALKYPDATHKACKIPPKAGASHGGLHVFIKRILYSFNNNFRWAILQVALIGVMLTSTIFYVPSSNIMNSVADATEESPIIVINRLGRFGIKNDYKVRYLINQNYLRGDELLYNDWDKLFNEEDIAHLSSISGVEQVQPCLTMTLGMKNYDPDEFRRNFYEEWKMNILENETKRNYFQPYADLLGLTLEEYLDDNIHYSHNVDVVAIDLEQVQDWNLWFTDVNEGEYPTSPEAGLLSIRHKDRLNGTNFFETRIEYYGSYNNSNEIKRYILYDVLTIPVTGYIESNESVFITDLNQIIAFLDALRQENSPPLPLYSDVYVKISHPLDQDKVIHEIKRMYPDVQITNIGTAPSALAQQYKTSAQLSRKISLAVFILLGSILILGKLIENHQSRKQIWLFKSRGWGIIELISYSFTRDAVLGLLGSAFAAILIISGKNILIDSVFPKTLAEASPSVSSVLEPVLYQILDQSVLINLPFMGVMLSVTLGILALTYSIHTQPPGVREEK
jgi:hypothetical protein